MTNSGAVGSAGGGCGGRVGGSVGLLILTDGVEGWGGAGGGAVDSSGAGDESDGGVVVRGDVWGVGGSAAVPDEASEKSLALFVVDSGVGGSGRFGVSVVSGGSNGRWLAVLSISASVNCSGK
jgi:hypothetical protein